MPITGDATVITIRALSITDPVYSITGYILDDEASGLNLVTVTLSGDASAEAISGAGLPIGENEPGLYRFTGLSNGDYVVTPTRSGYKFVQPLENVTIAYDNEIVDDMVGTQIWVISGYILDGDSAGIEGVTITLTGDASTETETDADGYYEFDEMYDGDYTITPTLAGYYFTADHEDVTVDGDDVVVDTMVFAGYLTLPYAYNMSDIAPSSGDLITQVDEWYADNDGLAGPSITTSVADNNGYTPGGVTKGATWYWDAAKELALCKFPLPVDPSVTSIRVAVLGFSNVAAKFTVFGLWNSLQTTGPTSDNFGNAYILGSADPDTATTASRYNTSTTRSEISSWNTTVNEDAQRYHWHRAWWDFSAGKVGTSLYRPEDSSTIWTKEENMHAEGIALGHVWTGTQYFIVANIGSGDNYNVVKLWVGSGSDAWPT